MVETSPRDIICYRVDVDNTPAGITEQRPDEVHVIIGSKVLRYSDGLARVFIDPFQRIVQIELHNAGGPHSATFRIDYAKVYLRYRTIPLQIS